MCACLFGEAGAREKNQNNDTTCLAYRGTAEQSDRTMDRFFSPRTTIINTEGHNGLIVFLLTSSEKTTSYDKNPVGHV